MDLNNLTPGRRVRATLTGGLICATGLLVPAVAYADHGPEHTDGTRTTAPVEPPPNPTVIQPNQGLLSQDLDSDTSILGPIESRGPSEPPTSGPGYPGPAADPADFGLLGIL
ncbi:hypothetical protein [Streptomyces sp. NBC_01304]|uniref:hypothetical protein n=1 Tax=Streptomyces sp. NBC_01304 TaxID=2903818 RepID=UPI002E0DDD8E|nr:hypothetical protein OG430_26575 [Streptomyces sp. NBC_01304]